MTHGTVSSFAKQPILALWGAGAAITLVLLSTPAARAQTLTTLYSFCPNHACLTGEEPASLIQATDGNFYGTATKGGANDSTYCPSYLNQVRGCGTVFRTTPSGTVTTLYGFCREPNCTDGALPQPALIQATNGDLYGTTSYGGANGGGTIFKITLSGKLTTLYNFCSQANCADGSIPQGGLMQASNGDLYGTTAEGGAYSNSGCAFFSDHVGCGTVFKITPAGTLTTLYNFCSLPNCADGAVPGAALVQATNEDLYGTTEAGGAAGIQYTGGTVFRITPGGKLTNLYSFSCSQPTCADGAFPVAPLVQASNGNLYGSTTEPAGVGTIFEVTPEGKLTTVYNFLNGPTYGGGDPQGALIQGTNGNFYGVTAEGGNPGGGTVFELSPSGQMTILYNFCSANETCTDGDDPDALIQATNGTFFGTTVGGGATNGGSLYSLSAGLGPFISLQTTAGRVGTRVTILGSDLNGATSVTFNGTPATFAVNSPGTDIVATVPTGATTGTVQVSTPNGVLDSNKVFRVTR
jgi:uncharacterized repeat protein (TIGR03803 family)